MLTIGSLFSGIGGLELGLEWSGLGKVIWQVEKDPFCRQVLEKHWPEVERFEDVKTFEGKPADLICGGFPCQDVSSAGKGKGLTGSRSGLWFEFARIIGAVNPQWVVIENVASGATRWVDQVCSCMEQLSYETIPIPLSARDVGAPHCRKRVFIVAHTQKNIQPKKVKTIPPTVPQDEKRPMQIGRIPDTKTSGSWGGRIPLPPIRRMDDGFLPGLDQDSREKRIGSLGNAVVPQCAEVIGYIVRQLAGL